MSAGTEPNKPTDINKSKTYFAIGGVFLLFMGLLSAIDQSIVYILLGASVYFFFLGFNSRPKIARKSGGNSRGDQSRSRQQAYQDPYARPTAGTGILEQLQKLRTIFHPGKNPQASNRRALKLFLIIFTGVFAIPIIASIFSSENGDGDASSYFQFGETNYNAGQYDSAYFYYKKAIAQEPEYEDAWLGYGKVFSAKGQCDSAIIIYDKVLELNAENKYATYYKAYCFYSQKKYSEGLDIVAPLVEENEDYYEAMLLLGDFYYAQDKDEDAFKWYNKAYDDGGMRGTNLCYILGYLYEDKKDVNRAINLYQEALTYDSTQVDIYKRLGELIPDSNGDYYRTKAAQLKPQ